MSNQKSINVRAKNSSELFGKNAITQSLPPGIDIPQVSVTDSGQRTEGCSSSPTVYIEVLECDVVSVADQTAVLVNINPPEETLPPAVCESLPEEGPITRVTGRTLEGTNNLHFFVHERGKHIQIGQCCLIVEIHVNDQMMEKLRAEGTLQVDTNIGGSLVTISWRGIGTDEEEMKTRIKVQLQSSLTEQLQACEKAVLQDLVDNQCDKCQQLVSFLFTKIEGHLTDISYGCLQFTVVFTDRTKLDSGTSPEALSAIREFLDSLLLTKDMENATSDVGFSISVSDQEVYDSTATFHSREQIPTITEEKQSELAGLRGDIPGETMRQDQLTSQMSEHIQKVVQKALSEELAHFLLEQTKILREAVEEVLPEMEQRIYEKISGESQVQDIQYSKRRSIFSSTDSLSPLRSRLQANYPLTPSPLSDFSEDQGYGGSPESSPGKESTDRIKIRQLDSRVQKQSTNPETIRRISRLGQGKAKFIKAYGNKHDKSKLSVPDFSRISEDTEKKGTEESRVKGEESVSTGSTYYV